MTLLSILVYDFTELYLLGLSLNGGSLVSGANQTAKLFVCYVAPN